MSKRSYKPEEIVAKLRQVDVLHSQGIMRKFSLQAVQFLGGASVGVPRVTSVLQGWSFEMNFGSSGAHLHPGPAAPGNG